MTKVFPEAAEPEYITQFRVKPRSIQPDSTLTKSYQYVVYRKLFQSNFMFFPVDASIILNQVQRLQEKGPNSSKVIEACILKKKT